MIITGDERGVALYKKYELLKSSRHNWQNHWDEIQNYFVPRKDNIYGYQVVGEKKTNHLYDIFALNALESMVSGLHGMLTNPSSVWFGLSTGDEELDAKDHIQKYLQTCVNIMIGHMNRSNFQTEIYEVYLDLGSFGTAVLRVEEDPETGVRFTAIPIYQCVVAENNKGIIDSTFFEYDMTVTNIIKEFPKTCPQEVKDMAQTDPSRKIKVLHVVEPNEDAAIMGMMVTKKRYGSTHILSTTKTILKEGGFHENPHIVPRWSKVTGEIYGRSPAMKCLPEVKMVNKMKKAVIEAAQLQVAPPTQAPDDGVILPLDLRPNGINFYRAGSRDRIEKIDLGGSVQLGEAELSRSYDNIASSFFIDKLQIREADRMTTVEIVQRRDEQLRVLSPILGRQHHELLDPLVTRVFNALDRQGKFPEPPEELVDRDLEVKFISQIAKAQRSAEGDAVNRTLQMILPMVEIKPEIMDNINADEYARFAASIHGLPHKILEDAEVVKKIRAERAQQMQKQEEQQDDLAQAEVVNKVGSVNA